MLAVPGRHRSFALLACMLAMQVLLLAVQIHRDQGAGRVRLIRVWAAGIVMPFEKAGNWSISKVRGVWSGYVGLVHAQRENQQLKNDIDALRMRNAELESQAADAQRLAALLGFRDAHPEAPMIAARVIASSADTSSRACYINRGSRDGIRRNMAVITPDGVVGKVIEVFGSTSQILLVTDRESGVGALFSVSRTMGIVGGASDPLLTMKYVSNDEPVKVGDQVVTSGQDQIFPKDLPVGIVAEATPGTPPFKQIRLKPAARLDRLEEVLVLLTRQELNTKPASAEKETEPGAAPVPAPAAVKK
jgi:rod shape-determining protein MreC